MRIFLIMSILILTACGCSKKNASEWSDKEINQWYDTSPWNDLPMKLDTVVNIRMFAEQNILNPRSWKAAYKFLSKHDFNRMELRNYPLCDDGTYASITEYQTKDSSHFEAHRKYIDIQFLVKGKEYVYITPTENSGKKIIKDYNPENDAELFDQDTCTRHMLYPGNFMVLFPNDAHKPSIKVNNNEKVRKVVVKVPYIKQ